MLVNSWKLIFVGFSIYFGFKLIIGNVLSCAFLFWRIFLFCFSRVPQRTHLALAAQSPKKLVALEFGLLVRYDPRHLENKPGWSRLLIETHPVKGQHADAGVLAHSMHHPDRRVLTVPPRRYLFSPSPRERDLDWSRLSLYYSRLFSREKDQFWKKVARVDEIWEFSWDFSSRADITISRSRSQISARGETLRHSRPRSTRCDVSLETGVPGDGGPLVLGPARARGTDTPQDRLSILSLSHPWNHGHLSNDRLSI